jgi:hypothetical protein
MTTDLPTVRGVGRNTRVGLEECPQDFRPPAFVAIGFQSKLFIVMEKYTSFVPSTSSRTIDRRCCHITVIAYATQDGTSVDPNQAALHIVRLSHLRTVRPVRRVLQRTDLLYPGDITKRIVT